MGKDKAFKIGRCLIQTADHSILFEDGSGHAMQPKYIEVLTYLASHHPRVIPRHELIDEIWNGNYYVGEKALTNTIWHLRQNLAEATEEGEVIETIRKAGYRLLLTPIWQQESIAETSIESSRIETKKLKVNIYVVSLILLCGILLFYSFSKPNQRLSIPIIEQVTRDPGSELFPSASPDGRFIAYSWVSPDGQTNMYMLDRSQPELAARQITFDLAEESQSVWSNSGTYLYFSRRNRTKSTCEIVQMEVATNQEITIADCPTRGGYYYLDIAPDDNTLAFRGVDKEIGNTGIYFIQLHNKDATPIRFSCSFECGYKDRDMAFSPDGKKIAITRRNYWFSEDILLVDLKTGDEQPLVSREEDIMGLTWHPDGDKIIYATEHANIKQGYVIDVHSKQKQALNVEGFSYPSYSKQSGELFFHYQSERYYISKLLIDKKVASSPFPVMESEFSHLYPDYSAKADRIVYVSNESGFYELWMADSSGMNRQQLTFLERSVNYPRWSHNGDKVAFLAPVENSNSDRIFIIEVESKKVTALASPFQLHNRPTWSFDDSAIISAGYNNEFTDLYQISIQGGATERLTFDNGRYGIMTSPTTLLYTRTKAGLWQKELGGKPFLKLDKDIFSARYAWIHDNNVVYYRQRTPEHQQYLRYDFNQEIQTELFRLPPSRKRGYQEISLNSQKGELLFTSGKSAQSDIKKLEHPLLN